MQKIKLGLKTGLVMIFISGCITRDYRGGVPIRPLQMEQIQSAKTKADVANILGTPAAVNMVGVEKWFYYNSEGSQFAFFDPRFAKYNILTITF
ncbi:MAG: outer membrane protein assembly factor BamE, partial [Bacteroidales bacterium]|nr:outer membrane protein assembly factor BamE [Bacteroidales bacterium]